MLQVFILLLDGDDEIDVDNLVNMVNHAKMKNLDCVKGYIKVIKGTEIIDMNRISCENKNSLEVIKTIISQQSTTADIIVKRDFLNNKKVRFNNKYKVGEDTLFYANIFMNNPKIEYFNSFFYYNHKRKELENLSSTQVYQDIELNNHIDVWNESENKLKKINLSYFDLRLNVAVKNAIISIIFYSNGQISKKSFSKFNRFLNNNINYLKDKLILHKRYEAVYGSIIENN